jgi:hypothetical protein
MNATEKCCEYKSKYTNNIYDVCEICKINRHLFISDRNNINYGEHNAANYEYGGHPAPAGPALPNLINAVSMLKSKSKHTGHRRGVPDSGTHDPHVTTTPAPTTSAAAETADSNVANTRGDPDASSPRDASRRRGRARDARTPIMRAATIRPVGVMFDLLADMLDVSVVIIHDFYIDKERLARKPVFNYK